MEVLQAPHSTASVAGVGIAAGKLLLAIQHPVVVGAPNISELSDQGAVQIGCARVVTSREMQVGEADSRFNYFRVLRSEHRSKCVDHRCQFVDSICSFR
ncbi:hypothetical protein ACIO14_30710 [Nocardia fluminea]|uniref:hypothetical protein n=1 Tax=Nocardia fluminea TaxID=134984 RepID=UPI00380C6633